jgi:general secretion pathway protein H
MQNSIPRFRGFTLIEILVVLVIIGMMLATVVIKAFPDERQTLRQEADRLGLLLEQARDEAFLSGHSVAWSIDKQTYTFWRLNAERRWAPIAGNQTLRLRTLPASISLTELTINAVKIPVSEHLIFSPSGLNTPFTATLELHGHRVHLLGDSAGRVQVKDEN